MQLQITAIALIATLLATVLASYFAFTNRTKPVPAFFLGVYFFGFALWTLGILANLMLYMHNPLQHHFEAGSLPYLIEQIIFFAPIIFFTGKVFFVETYPENRLPRKWWKYWPLAVALPIAIAVWVPHTLFTFIDIQPLGYTFLDMGPWTGAYSLFLLSHFVYVIFLARRKIKQARSTILQQQFRYILWAHNLTFIVTLATNWIMPVVFDMHFFNAFGPVTTFISVAAFAYAVTHYRFLDIRLSLQRTLTYASAAIVTIGTITAVTLHVPADNPYLLIFANTTTLLTSAVLLSPLLRILNKASNFLLYGSLINYREELGQFIARIRMAGLSMQESTEQLLAALSHALDLQGCRFVPLPQLAFAGGSTGYHELFRGRDVLSVDELTYEGETGDARSQLLAKLMKHKGIDVLAPIMRGDACLGAIATERTVSGRLLTSNELEEIRRVADSAAEYLSVESTSILREREELAELQHHINTPLTRIELEMQEMRRDTHIAVKHNDTLSRISQELFQTSRTVQYFFEIERVHDYTPLLREASVAKQAIDHALQNVSGELGKMGIQASSTIKVKGELHVSLKGNAFIIGSLLTELFINAFKFGKEPITVEVVATADSVAFRVMSVGHLTAQEIGAAMQKFSYRGTYSGSGLGLSYVRTFAEAMGGSFRLASTPRRVIAEIVVPRAG